MSRPPRIAQEQMNWPIAPLLNFAMGDGRILNAFFARFLPARGSGEGLDGDDRFVQKPFGHAKAVYPEIDERPSAGFRLVPKPGAVGRAAAQLIHPKYHRYAQVSSVQIFLGLAVYRREKPILRVQGHNRVFLKKVQDFATLPERQRQRFFHDYAFPRRLSPPSRFRRAWNWAR